MTLRLGSLKDLLLLYTTRTEVIFRTYFIVSSYTFMELQSAMHISNDKYNTMYNIGSALQINLFVNV